MRVWAILLVMLLCAGPASARDPVRLQLKWTDLGSRIVNRKVALTTPDSVSIEGRVTGVEANGLHIDISKTSNRKALSKGKQSVARQSVTALRITEYRKVGRLIGTFGAMGAAAGIVAAQSIDLYEGPAVILVPVMIAVGVIGAGIAGYFVGKSIDKRVTEIVIVP